MPDRSCCKCARWLTDDDSFWQVGNQHLCQQCWESICANAWWEALDELKDTEGV